MNGMHGMHDSKVAKLMCKNIPAKLVDGEKVIDKGTFCDFVVASNVNRAHALLKSYMEGRASNVPKCYLSAYPKLASVMQPRTYQPMGNKSRVTIPRFSVNPYAEFNYSSFDANLVEAMKAAHEGFSTMKASRKRSTQWIEIGVLDERYVQYVIQRNQLSTIPGHTYDILDGLGQSVDGHSGLYASEGTMSLFESFVSCASVYGEAPAGGKWILHDVTRNCNAQEYSLVASDPASPSAFKVRFSLFIAWGTYQIIAAK